MPKRPFQSLQYPLTAHQIESLNSMLESLFQKSNSARSSELTGILAVDKGGTGRASAIPYSVICGGISTTGQHQSVADVGTSGQLLTSNGAGTLPTWEDAPTPIATLDDLTDVTITTPAEGDVLVYDDGTNQWVNEPAGVVYYEWSVLTNGDVTSPELIFAGGDVIMIRVP
jgi:hypothetical protein